MEYNSGGKSIEYFAEIAYCIKNMEYYVRKSELIIFILAGYIIKY